MCNHRVIPFRTQEKTLGELLRQEGVYHTGQMNLPHECYSDGKIQPRGYNKGNFGWSVPRQYERRYSPFVNDASDDYDVPEYLMPMRLLQMSFSTGTPGTGVTPEDHPSAWFASIKGRKRWAFHPPNFKTLPDHVHGVFRDRKSDSCAIRPPYFYTSTLVCDQPAGSIMWTPQGPRKTLYTRLKQTGSALRFSKTRTNERS